MKNKKQTIRKSSFSVAQILNNKALKKIKGGDEFGDGTLSKYEKFIIKDTIKCEKEFQKSINGDGLW